MCAIADRARPIGSFDTVTAVAARVPFTALDEAFDLLATPSEP